MLAHVAGIPVEEALLAAPALLAGVTVIAGYVRATAARPRRWNPRLAAARFAWRPARKEQMERRARWMWSPVNPQADSYR